MSNLGVTLLMPVRNGANFIERSVGFLMQNARPTDEILIVDDGSEDETPTILKRLSQKHPILHVVKGHGNGLAHALNLGVSEAEHPWIARFDVDDRYPGNRLEIQRGYISGHVVSVFSDYNTWNTNNRFLGQICSPIFPTPTKLSLILNQRTAHPSVLFSKSAVIEVGKYREDYFPAEDLDLWYRLGEIGDLISAPVPLLDYTIHQHSTSATKRQDMIKQLNRITNEMRFTKNFEFKVHRFADEELWTYRNMDNPDARILLFLREYFIYAKLYENRSASVNRMAKLIKQHVTFTRGLSAISELAYYKLIRSLS